MTDFHDAKRDAAAKHAAWSAAERNRLTKDRVAIGEAIRTGAINNLTTRDREALIATFGAPRPAAPVRRTQRTLRTPRPLEPASNPVAQRQSWAEGEFGRALTWALLLGVAIPMAGVILLRMLWAWEHM